MRWFLEHYLSGGRALQRPAGLASARRRSGIRGIASNTRHHRRVDPLRDEGEAYADRLRAVGVAAETTRYDGMVHGFFSLGEFLSDGRRALTQAADALGGAIGSTVAPETSRR